MDRFRSGRSLSPIRQAEAYWTTLLARGAVPSRADIDPRGLENILEYTFILERIAPSAARFRLAGSHLCKLAGMEVRGMPLTAFIAAGARNDISSMLQRLFDTPAVGEVELISEQSVGRAQLEARMILLPLRSDLGDVNRLLGVLVADGAPSKTPCRFATANLWIRDLDQMRSKRSGQQQPVPGLAEAQRGFRHAAPHLRLVVSRSD